MKPQCLEYLWPVLDAAFDAGRVLSALFLIFLYIRGRRVPSKLVWVQAVLQGWFLLLTYMRNPERLWGVVISTVSILTVACAVDLFSARPAMLTRGLMGIMEWLIYGNLLSIILTYPQGLYISVGHGQHCYFLGYRNGFFQYALLAILAAMLYSHIEKKKVRPLCLIAASYLCILITWSATSVAALMAVSVLIIIPSQKLRRWVTFPRVFGGAMAVNLAITVFRVMDRVPWIAWFIVRILNKRTTLTGRTDIWNQFQRKFFAHPFLGYGAGDHVLDPFSRVPVGAHNQYFELLLEGGVFALALFLLLNILMGNALSRCKDAAVRYIFLSVLAGLYVIFIAEAYLTPLICALMTLAYHAEKFACVPGPTTRRLRFVIKRGSHVTN